MKIPFKYALLIATLAWMSGCNRNQQQITPPNIIFILADDLGAGDLHCTGHPYAMTPNLDALAGRGVRFDRAYMAGAWCAPSRYGIMSGRFPAHYFDATRNISPEEPTVTAMLSEAGYHTAHFGKWHLTSQTDQTSRPADFGIDAHFLTNFRGGQEVNTWTREERNHDYWRAKTTDAYVDMTIDFIQQNASDSMGRPFYVNLWIYPTHSYIHPTPEQLAVYEGLEVETADFSPYQETFLKFVSRYGDIDSAMQAYCADVTAMDRALGRLFEFLEQQGLEENTLIVFTSDNGPGPLTTQVNSGSVAERYRERPDLLNSVGSARIYRERKVSLYDGGIRVPFIVSWPKKIPFGRVDSSSVIHGTDWLPTVASLCQVALDRSTLDGMDVTAAFMGEGQERTKDIFWTQAGSIALLKDHWKALLNKDGTLLLYDIVKDPEEKTNLATTFPEQASSMEKLIRNWKANLSP